MIIIVTTAATITIITIIIISKGRTGSEALLDVEKEL